MVVIWQHNLFMSHPLSRPTGLQCRCGHLAIRRVRIQPVSRSSPGLQWWSSSNTSCSGPALLSPPGLQCRGDHHLATPSPHLTCCVLCGVFWKQNEDTLCIYHSGGVWKSRWTSLIVLMVSVNIKQHWDIASELRSCVKVEMAVLGSPSLTVLMVSVDVKLDWNMVTESELRSCVKVEVDVLGSTSLTVLMDRVDVKQYWTWGTTMQHPGPWVW